MERLTGPAHGRVPVCSVWQPAIGPVLSLGMITAAARAHDGGSLASTYDIWRPGLAADVLERLAGGSGPAVLLCADYVWSLTDNLDFARQALEVRPELVVVHGGPSCPRRPEEAEQFLIDNSEVAHVLTRGEGEAVIGPLLAALGGRSWSQTSTEQLSEVAGLTFKNSAGETIQTAEPERIADLDSIPSPYLTGEFDDIDPAAWHFCLSIETNRGCPYGCTFCDWGSSTLSRIRKFPVERVAAEMEWAASRQVHGVQLCDANFGIMARDVEIAESVAGLHQSSGWPKVLAFTPAKNTSRHLTKIFDALLDAGVVLGTAISLQTTDETTLELVERRNISTDGYLRMAADLRRRGQPLEGDLLLGLPGQTYDTYKRDLQFFVDHEIAPRTWHLRLLPNAPMNDPVYRSRHGIETDDDSVVVATNTMSRADRDRMVRLRKAQVIATKFGTLRHVLRYVQWDHGLSSLDVIESLLASADADPRRYPLTAWLFEYFDLYPTVPVGWAPLLDEVRAALHDLGVESSSALDTVFEVQRALLPAPERRFPYEVELAHDYVAYYRSGTESLYTTGHAGRPERPLAEMGAGQLVVTDDRDGLCRDGLHFIGDSRDPALEGTFWIGIGFSYELPAEPALSGPPPAPVAAPEQGVTSVSVR